MKVVYDTDPGIDDAMALLYLNAIPDVELMGITTILGNANIEICTRNALLLCERFGIDIPVYRGSESSVTGDIPEEYPDFVHGADGLGDLNLEAPVKQAEDKPAYEYLVEAAKKYPHEITLMAVGRVTNLALALQADPEFQDLIKNVIIMGGAVDTPGNVTPWAEANIIGDPEAAEAVFNSRLNLTLVGLDVTNKTRMSISYLNTIFHELPHLKDFIIAMNSYYANFYLTAEGTDDFPVHDSSAIAYLDDPETFKVIRGKLNCIITGEQRGRTIFDANPEGRHQFCLDVDSTNLLENYRTRVLAAYKR